MIEFTIIACTVVVLMAIWGTTVLILDAIDGLRETAKKCERWNTP